jgi:hypothetical protein
MHGVKVVGLGVKFIGFVGFIGLVGFVELAIEQKMMGQRLPFSSLGLIRLREFKAKQLFCYWPFDKLSPELDRQDKLWAN